MYSMSSRILVELWPIFSWVLLRLADFSRDFATKNAGRLWQNQGGTKIRDGPTTTTTTSVGAAALQKCRSEFFLRFSLPKVSWNLAWTLGEIFCATFSRVWVCEGNFHQNFTSKTVWKTESFMQISLCWVAALIFELISRHPANFWFWGVPLDVASNALLHSRTQRKR